MQTNARRNFSDRQANTKGLRLELAKMKVICRSRATWMNVTTTRAAEVHDVGKR